MKVELSELNSGLTLKVDKENKEKSKDFSEILTDFIKNVNTDLLTAKEVEKSMAQGKIENLQEALYTIEKADISFRLLTEIRNKALESYQEIMRMQI